MLKRSATAWAVSFVVMFGLAGLFNTLIIREFVTARIPEAFLRAPPDMMLIAGGYLLLALLMSVIYPRVTGQPQSPLKSGLAFGAATAVCWQLPYSLVLHGVYIFPIEALLIDTGWALVEQGAGGVAIGVIYGWGKRKNDG